MRNICQLKEEAHRISVILPTHNRASLVGRAIRSVLAQTFRDWELLVVDDDSIDNTREVVLAFRDPRIVIFAGKSMAAGWRRGILASPLPVGTTSPF